MLYGETADFQFAQRVVGKDEGNGEEAGGTLQALAADPFWDSSLKLGSQIRDSRSLRRKSCGVAEADLVNAADFERAKRWAT